MFDKRRHLPHVLSVTALGAALLWFGVVSGFAADKSTETAGSLGTYHWTSTNIEVSPNGTVEFKNSESISHGVVFESPPTAPNCTGVPNVGTTGPWNGSCEFTQAGTYKFYCPVHPTEMKGTVTVSGPATPTATTEPATGVTRTEATLHGKVNPSGQATTYFFKYGLTGAYGQETTHESAGSGGTAIPEFANVSGLTEATTYHFEMVAEYGSGTLVLGADRTFKTAGPPIATTEPASGVGSIEATLKGSVTPNGLSTEYFFKYGTTTNYDHETTPALVSGTGSTPVPESAKVSGLTPKTTYHFLLVAKNSAGEVEGSDQSFTTSGGPIATTGQATGVTETAATLAGSVNPQGQPTNYYFNYGTTNAYGQKTTEKSTGAGTSNIGISESLTGLAAGTTYHFQLVAKNAGGTSPGADQVFTTAATPSPPPPPPPPPVLTPQPVIPPPTSSPPPETKITLKPAAKTRDRTPTIKFSATGGSASYTCSVDSKPFKACRSPFTAPSLKPGKHRIRVKAIVAGVVDPTPASCSFKVVVSK
jgi:plastocyanin